MSFLPITVKSQKGQVVGKLCEIYFVLFQNNFLIIDSLIVGFCLNSVDLTRVDSNLLETHILHSILLWY